MEAMKNSMGLSAEERLYGLSFIWQEANYNFAYFDRVPDLDWEAAYRETIPRVLAAEDVFSYYEVLGRFVALLKDGHTVVVPPRSVYLTLDRPKIRLMNIQKRVIVTNASQSTAQKVPIGSELLAIEDIPVNEYLAERVKPNISETTEQRLLDHAISRLLLGPQGSQVKCQFQTPEGKLAEMELLRNRRSNSEAWVRKADIPDRWEFMYFDEWLFEWFNCDPPFRAFEFRRLEGNIAYVGLNSFMRQEIAEAFEEKLPEIKRSSGVILDLRKNHGGSDSVGYRIVAHFLRQPTETLIVQSLQNIASYRSNGVVMKDTPPDKLAELGEWERKCVRCYRRQLFYEENWGNIQATKEIIQAPTAILTDSETGSAAEDFLMALQSGKGQAKRIGRSTAGSTGQPLIQYLPGGGQFGICTIRMPWPEEIWQKGIEPDIWVEPTVEDVMRDEDRALKAAVDDLCV
jgi:carboxyl-terminal processing protease